MPCLASSFAESFLTKTDVQPWPANRAFSSEKFTELKLPASGREESFSGPELVPAEEALGGYWRKYQLLAAHRPSVIGAG